MADNSKRQHLLSLCIVILLSAIITGIRFVFPPESVLSWDVKGYYLYLPALFIYGDLPLHDMSWLDHIIDQYHTTATLYQAIRLESGSWVMKYSMGLAVLYAPFFFLGHLAAHLLGYPADGFSAPYQYAIAIGGLVYTITGLLILRKVLLRFFNDKISAAVILLIGLGTNYFHITSFENVLSHNFLFTLYTLILWLTIRWHENPRMRHAVWLGVVMGLAILSRPSEIVCVFIPLLWGVTGKQSFRDKIQLIKSYQSHVIALAAALILIGLPQLIYWKLITGNFFFYSYTNPGEGLDFLSPHTINSLFSFRKGWYIYTPLMAFATWGFYFVYKRKREIFFPLFIFFVANLYIVSSWTCWWYAGSFSQRALMQSYAVMVIPLGYMLVYVSQLKLTMRSVLFSLFGLLTLLNLFQTWQFSEGIIDRERMSRKYYFAVFGKMRATEADRKLLLVERSVETFEYLENETDFNRKTLELLDFEKPPDSDLQHYSTDMAHTGKYAIKMDSAYQFSPSISKPFHEITGHYYAWIRASVYIYPVHDVKENPASLVVTFQHKGKNYKYRAIDIEKEEYGVEAGKWNRITIDYMTPELRSKKDNLQAYVWLRGKNEIYVDDLLIEVFEPKEFP